MKKITVLAVAAIMLTLVFSAFLLRENRLTAYKLCQVLYVRIAAADAALGAPRSSSYDYFHEHPQALVAAHQEDLDTLASLPCTAP